MVSHMSQSQLTLEDAIDHLGRHLAAKFGYTSPPTTGMHPASAFQCAPQYDVEIKYVAAAFWTPKGIAVLNQTMAEAQPYCRPFFDAAWYLCRIGVLRPGETAPSVGVRGPGWSGDGFSVTSAGHQWLTTLAKRPPSEPTRVVQILRPFEPRFGAGFLQRAAEASACYQTGNYLACCAMAGAAAESILLALGIAKISDEAQVLREYRSAQGRARITSRILSGANRSLTEQFGAMNNLLYYWRDETSHGVYTTVGEEQANLSLAQLVRFAHLVNDHWEALTS